MNKDSRFLSLIKGLINNQSVFENLAQQAGDIMHSADLSNKNKGFFENLLNKYVIIRSYDAGVFYGIVSSLDGDKIILNNCRRVYSWIGAASISQIAMDGCDSTRSKISVITNNHLIYNVIEIIPCSKKAITCISAIPFWKC